MQSSEMEIMALEGGVLLPGAILPLNIFEPRYTKMLSEGLKGNRTFAVCHIEEGKPAQYYGLGLIKSSVRHENGTYIVTLEGVTRYRINKIVSMVPLLRVESQLAVIESKVASWKKLSLHSEISIQNPSLISKNSLTIH